MMQTVVFPDLNVAPDPVRPTEAPNPRTVLEELFVLLEDYAPVWYQQKHHDRAISALLGKEL
jgi:hypothetical protein